MFFVKCLDRFEIEKSFSSFQNKRMPKIKKAVKTSWRIGKMAHWRNPLAVGVRN
jgi:2-polyprenyl-6-methoxyphenol hydroxylase-like FAD-dependent oxidoreductase